MTVHCAGCGFDNPDRMKFCGGCGSPLPAACPDCGFQNPPGFKFCGQCGRSLAGAPAPRPSPPPAEVTSRLVAVRPPGSPDPDIASVREEQGERKLITVMFCDLTDYTGLSESLDPEELQKVVRHFQHVCSGVIASYGGHIAQLLGDGILVYFGYPTGHEDDARRAVHAGLAIVRALDAAAAELSRFTGRKEAVRVGIHTGMVVTGEMGSGTRRERLALGRTPNIAARLETLAEPGEVVISDATHRLTRKYFEFDAMGPQKLKGILEPMPVFRVRAERERETVGGLEILEEAATTPFVGRTREVQQLEQLWAQVALGNGQIVLLMGEAGVGKSRLMKAFRQRLSEHDYHFLWAQASAYGEATMLGPVIDMLVRTFGISRGDRPEDSLSRVEQSLKVYGLDLDRFVPLFAGLLQLPLPPRYSMPEMTPQLRKRRTLEAIIRLMEGMAQEQPLLLVIEDLHWIDPSTQELLDLLVAQSATHPMLTFLTSRPEFTHQWASRSWVTMLNLNRLGGPEVVQMVERVTGGRPLPREVVEEITAKTDGVPLFVEELTKAVIESGIVTEQGGRYVLTGSLSTLSIPATLQESLAARLDALPAGKEVAQMAATIGREFSYELLAAIAEMREEALQRALDELVAAEFLYQRGLPPHASYIFKHALIQDAAAASLLRSRQQRYHLRIARELERRVNPALYPLPYDPPAPAAAGRANDRRPPGERFSDSVAVKPERLAHHYTEGGAAEQAVDWWLRAGVGALERSANFEVIKHMERALHLLASMESTPENRRREQAVQTVYGPALVAIRGYADASVERAFTRALALCDPGDSLELFKASLGLWMFHVVRASFPRARDYATKLMQVAEEMRDTSLQVDGHFAMGCTAFFMGRPAQAMEHFQAGASLDSPSRDRSMTLRSNQDAGVCCLTYMGMCAWLLGRPEEATPYSQRAENLARQIDHPFSLVYALQFRGWQNLWMGDYAAAKASSDEVIRMSEEGGLFWVTLGTCIRGRVMAEAGDIEGGLKALRWGLEAFLTPGARLSQTLQLAFEAEICLKAGLIERGLQRIGEAQSAIEETDERFWAPEIRRLEGDLLAGTDLARAETCYRQALELARTSGAPGLAERALGSLAGLLTRQNRDEEARALQVEPTATA
ncbi:AAA family ATPase [soil metagenome]